MDGMIITHTRDGYRVTGTNDRGQRVTFEGFTTRRLAEQFYPYIRLGAVNPVLHTTEAYGHTLRRFANGMWDAVDGPVASISPGFDSEDDLRYWLAKETEARRNTQRLGAAAASMEDVRIGSHD